MTREAPDRVRSNGSGKPLDGWKEIAVYLGKSVRTAKRWEQAERLPVRRITHGGGTTVYAFPGELDDWRERRAPAESSPAKQNPLWRRPLAALVCTTVMGLMILTAGSGPNLGSALAASDSEITARRVEHPDALWPMSVSSDGGYMAAVNPTGMILINLQNGEARTLRPSGTDQATFSDSPVFSPDGTRIAYTWCTGDQRGELRLMSLETGEDRLLYDGQDTAWITPADWTPDGKEVLAAFNGADGFVQLALISAEDGTKRALKTLDKAFHFRSRLSPDGRFVAYDYPPPNGPGLSEIYILDVEQRTETPLVEHSANDLLLGWAPDGKSVLFASDRRGQWDAWFQPVTGGEPEEPAKMVMRNLGQVVPLGICEDGSFYYFAGGWAIETDVYTAYINLETGAGDGEPELASELYLGANRFLNWSPDGDRVAWVSLSEDTQFGGPIVHVRTESTGETRTLYPKLDRISIFGFLWSADGTSITLAGSDFKHGEGLFRMDAASGAVFPRCPCNERTSCVPLLVT